MRSRFTIYLVLLVLLATSVSRAIPRLCKNTARVAEETGLVRSFPASPAAPDRPIEDYSHRQKLEVGTIFLEKFKLVERLSDDSQADVFLAKTLPEGPGSQPVVLRITSNVESERQTGLIQRARLQPNGHLIVEAQQIGPALAMVHREGTQDLLKAMEKPLATKEIKSILSQLAYGLKAIHDAGIVHRDIKPANILLLPDGEIRIIDFGISVYRRDPPMFADGTPGYVPPEILVNGTTKQKPTRRQDTYAWQQIAKDFAEIARENFRVHADMESYQTFLTLKRLSNPEQRFESADDIIEFLNDVWPNAGQRPP